ncbi:MAG: adenylate/guanylate cyclase domain-containing protein [Chloroflexota bacterium]
MIPDTRYARTADATNIAYQVLGDGPVDLLWLDGARGNLEVMWEQPLVAEFFTKLATQCRVIRIDMRGTGLSDRGEQPPNLETQMDDARSVLDVIGSQRTAIAGHGWGCAAASMFASTFPRRTTALVLASAQARNRWAPYYPWGFTEEVLNQSLRMVESGWGTEGHAAWVLSLSAPSMLDDRAYVRWEAKVQRHWVGPRAAAVLERQFWDSDVRDVLRTLQVPTLVVAREWDDPEEDEYVAGLIPNARLVRLPGRDWTVWVGDQDAVVTAIHRFLEARPPTRESDAVLATVLFTDIVDSTHKAAQIGDRAWRDLVEHHHLIVRALLQQYRGVEVDTAGDGFFATFDGPARAIRCAGAIVEQVRRLGIEVRAGLHTGECETIDGKIGGITVNIGARVGAAAGPSEVVVSQTVKDLVAGSGLAFEDRGERELRGVPEQWRLFRVVG